MVDYDINPKLNEIVNDLLANEAFGEFEDIRNAELRVLAVLRVQTDKEGEHVEKTGIKVELKKIPAMLLPFLEGGYVLVVDYYAFTHYNVTRFEALLHKAMMSIQVEEADGGGWSIKPRKPDIVEYNATISRYGAYEEKLVILDTILSGIDKSARITASKIADSQ